MSLMEGFTSKIGARKRTGNGYRDGGHFFLGIMAASPGIPDNAA